MADEQILNGSLMLDSTFMIQTIVIMVTLKIIVSTNTHTIWSWLIQSISVGFFYAQFAVESILHGMDLSGVMPQLMKFSTQYFLLFFFMIGFILVDYGMQILDIYVQDTLEKIEDAKMKNKLLQKVNERANRGRKVTEYQHMGYGFDGAAGHDILVTDKIAKRFEKAFFDHIGRGPSMFGVEQLSGSFKQSRFDS